MPVIVVPDKPLCPSLTKTLYDRIRLMVFRSVHIAESVLTDPVDCGEVLSGVTYLSSSKNTRFATSLLEIFSGDPLSLASSLSDHTKSWSKKDRAAYLGQQLQASDGACLTARR